MDVNQQLIFLLDTHHRPLWDREMTLKRGELLSSAGATDTNIYYVLEGSLNIYYENNNEFNSIRFGYSGSLFTSLDSFLSGKPSLYAVEAIKQCRLKVMSKDDFMEFVNSSSENLKLWNRILSYTVTSLLERELDLLTASPAERYRRVLERSPQLFQEIPHKYIASYLRMAPETLSRLLKS